MQKNVLVGVLAASRTSFAQDIDEATAAQAKDMRHAEYGLSVELALQDGVGIGQKVIDISA